MPTELRYKNFEFQRSYLIGNGVAFGSFESHIQSVFGEKNYIPRLFNGWKYATVRWGETFKQFVHANSDYKTVYGRRVTTYTNINNGATSVTVQRYRTRYGGTLSGGQLYVEPTVFTPSAAAFNANGGTTQTGAITYVSPTLYTQVGSNPANYTIQIELQDGFSLEEACQIVRNIVNGPPEPNYTDFAAGGGAYGDTYDFRESPFGSGTWAVVPVLTRQVTADLNTNNAWMASGVSATVSGSPSNVYIIAALKVGLLVTGGLLGKIDVRKYCRSQWTYKGPTGAGGAFSAHENCQMSSGNPLATTLIAVDLPVRNPDVNSNFTEAYAVSANELYFPGYPANGASGLVGPVFRKLPPPGPCCQLT